MGGADKVENDVVSIFTVEYCHENPTIVTDLVLFLTSHWV